MGYRAHVNKKRIVEYGEGLFNYCSQGLADFLYGLKYEMDTNYEPFYIHSEFGELLRDWEIEREWLEKAIEYIKENKNFEDEAFDEYTYKNIIDNFQYWLDKSDIKENFSDPSFVYITWY